MKTDSEEQDSPSEDRLVRVAKDTRTPSEIAAQLREFCIGQDDVVDAVAATIFQHLARCKRATGLPILSHLHIPPILMIGPTGCGKSTLMRAAGRITGLPVYMADATRLTEEGYVGESTSDWIRGLLMAAGGHKLLAEHGILVIDEIDKRRAFNGGPGGPSHRDVSGTGAQEGLLDILSGGTVMVDVSSSQGGSKKRVPVRTGHIMIVLAGAFDGLEDIVRTRIRGKERIGLGHRPTCDSDDIDVSTAGVRPDDLIQYGLHRQLVGRLERCLVLNPLSDQALRGILTQARDGPIWTQQRIAEVHGFRFEFSENLIDLMVSKARDSGLGARALWGLVSAATERAWYEVPDRRRDENEYPWGRTVVRLRTDSLTDNYYGLSVTDQIILADSEEGRDRTVASTTADAT